MLINEERILIKEYIGRKHERTIGKQEAYTRLPPCVIGWQISDER